MSSATSPTRGYSASKDQLLARLRRIEDDHAHHCVTGAAEGERDAKTEELMAAVGRLMRRG